MLLAIAGADAPDVGPPALEVVCSPAQAVRPGEMARVFAELVSPAVDPLEHSWQVLEGEGVMVGEPRSPATGVQTDIAGRIILRYTVIDRAGSVGTCTSVVAVEIVSAASLPNISRWQSLSVLKAGRLRCSTCPWDRKP